MSPRPRLTGIESIGGLDAYENTVHQIEEKSSMRNFVSLVKQMKSDESGAAFVEYTVLLGVMLVAVIAVIGAVGVQLHTSWNTLTAAL
jgi:pilus assembly protein Flp/PilA